MAYAYGGTTITDILNSWADMGVFAYVLPFLMIFAVVFGLMNKSKILGTNKGVQAVIALSVGLLSLQFDYVSNFFASIFPYFGMGLAVLLVALILMGFITDDSKAQWIWFGLGAVIFIVVLMMSISDASWIGGYGFAWNEAWKSVLTLIVLAGFIALIVWGSKDK